MSADFINKLGSPVAGYSQGYVAIPRQQGPSEVGKPGQSNGDSSIGSVEGYHPTAEAKESTHDTRAGEARASQFFAAWGSAGLPNEPAVANTGALQIQGAAQTAIHQAYSSSGIQPGAPESGFTAATVYSSKPTVL